MTKQMIKMSFSMMSWSDVADQQDEAGDYDLSTENATSQGRELIDKAIEIIENVNAIFVFCILKPAMGHH